MKAGPSHRIRLYVKENAIPLNANDAMRGSPSPWKVLAMMPIQAAEMTERLRVSELLNVVEDIMDDYGLEKGKSIWCSLRA